MPREHPPRVKRVGSSIAPSLVMLRLQEDTTRFLREHYRGQP